MPFNQNRNFMQQMTQNNQRFQQFTQQNMQRQQAQVAATANRWRCEARRTQQQQHNACSGCSRTRGPGSQGRRLLATRPAGGGRGPRSSRQRRGSRRARAVTP